jgi:hypothetical protein
MKLRKNKLIVVAFAAIFASRADAQALPQRNIRQLRRRRISTLSTGYNGLGSLSGDKRRLESKHL